MRELRGFYNHFDIPCSSKEKQIQSLRVSASERGNLPPAADITHVFIKHIT
jgi:hypothetical protein